MAGTVFGPAWACDLKDAWPKASRRWAVLGRGGASADTSLLVATACGSAVRAGDSTAGGCEVPRAEAKLGELTRA